MPKDLNAVGKMSYCAYCLILNSFCSRKQENKCYYVGTSLKSRERVYEPANDVYNHKCHSMIETPTNIHLNL